MNEEDDHNSLEEPGLSQESDSWEPSRRRRRYRRRRIKAISVLPSLFTLGNLIAGFAAIHYASKPIESASIGPWAWSPLTMAGTLIFIGMFCDAIDGSVARLTRTTSDIGAQLDSLADIVTFGVAPAYMTLTLVSKYYLADDAVHHISPDNTDAFARVFWAIAAIYVCCAALRLARFNVETGTSESVDDHMIFRGLPSPGAAGCLTSLILLHQSTIATIGIEWVATSTALGMAGIMLACALAMVSPLPYVHAANRYLRGQGSFAYVVTLLVILVCAVFYTQEMLAIGFTTYALSAPTYYVWTFWKRRARQVRAAATSASNGNGKTQH